MQSFLVVAPQHHLAEELHREVGNDFRLIPLQSVAESELSDAPDQRVAAVVIRMSPDAAVESNEILPPPPAAALTLEAQVDVLERRVIEDSLERHNHRRKETASELGISRVTLYNKMKKFGLLG